MKMLSIGFVRLVCALFLIVFSTYAMAGGNGPTLEVVNKEVDLAKEKKVSFAVKGFKPSNEFTLLFTDVNGTQNDIGAALKPAPKADGNGEWKGAWSIKRYLKAKIIKEGKFKISLTDADYNEIDSKTVKFTGKPKKRR